MTEKPDGLSLGPEEDLLWTGNRAKRSIVSSTGERT